MKISSVYSLTSAGYLDNSVASLAEEYILYGMSRPACSIISGVIFAIPSYAGSLAIIVSANIASANSQMSFIFAQYSMNEFSL